MLIYVKITPKREGSSMVLSGTCIFTSIVIKYFCIYKPRDIVEREASNEPD